MVEQRVQVMEPDQSADLGQGTYLGDTTLRAEALLGFVEGPFDELTEMFADEVTPKIRLDSGEIVYGITCWWSPIELTAN